MAHPNDTLAKQNFWAIALSKQVFPRAVRVALIVGTILALINHGDKIIPVSMTSLDLVKVVLTYFVPYSVSTWSAVEAIRSSVVKSV